MATPIPLTEPQQDVLEEMLRRGKPLVRVSTWYWSFRDQATFGRQRIPTWSAPSQTVDALIRRGLIARRGATIELTESGRAAVAPGSSLFDAATSPTREASGRE